MVCRAGGCIHREAPPSLGGHGPLFPGTLQDPRSQAHLRSLGPPRGPLGAGKRWARPSGAGRRHLRRSPELILILHPPVRSLRPVGTARAVRRTAGSAADTCFVPVPGGVRGSPGRQRLMGGGRQRWGQTQGPRCPALGSFRGQGPSTRSGYGQTGLSSSLLWGEQQGEDVQEKMPRPRGKSCSTGWRASGQLGLLTPFTAAGSAKDKPPDPGPASYSTSPRHLDTCRTALAELAPLLAKTGNTRRWLGK